MSTFVSYYHDDDGTVIVETPNTALAFEGQLQSRRRWHLDVGGFAQLQAQNPDVEFRLIVRPTLSTEPNTLVHREVSIPCPTGKHGRSIVTFRNHTVAAMFCIPCELAWTQPTSHPELRAIRIDGVPARFTPPERRKRPRRSS